MPAKKVSVSMTRRDYLKKMYDAGRWFPIYIDHLYAMTIEECLVFGQLMNVMGMREREERKMLHEDGKEWFLYTANNMCNQMCISIETQKRILRNLERKGYIKRKQMGNPAKRYFYLDVEAVDDAVKAGYIKARSGGLKSTRLGGLKSTRLR